MKARILSWDYREQPDLAALRRILVDLFGDRVHLAEVDTGDDQYAIVLSDSPVTGEQAADMYRGRFAVEGGPAPEHGPGSLPHGYVPEACDDWCNNAQCPAGSNHDRCTPACLNQGSGVPNA